MESVNAKYVSQKISKTRWRPVSHSSLQQPDIFVTGSWDNEVGKLSINANVIINANRDCQKSSLSAICQCFMQFASWRIHIL